MRLVNDKRKGLKLNAFCIYFMSFEGSHALQPTFFKPPLNPFMIPIDFTHAKAPNASIRGLDTFLVWRSKPVLPMNLYPVFCMLARNWARFSRRPTKKRYFKSLTRYDKRSLALALIKHKHYEFTY